ncbi:TPA: hypothetical protein ACH3X3_001592 [Trebouxia sp. C0006]
MDDPDLSSMSAVWLYTGHSGQRALPEPCKTSSSRPLDSAAVEYIWSEIVRLHAVLKDADEWSFDARRLSAESSHPLTVLTVYLTEKAGLRRNIKYDANKFVAFLMRVEGGYHNNPYHNKQHVAGVVHLANKLFYTLHDGGSQVFTAVEHFALLLSAVVHDLGHGGVSNDYLIQTSSNLLGVHGKESLWEKHHLCRTLSLLQDPRYQFFEECLPFHQDTMLRMCRALVLQTDMAKHKDFMNTAEAASSRLAYGIQNGETAFGDKILLLQDAYTTRNNACDVLGLPRQQNQILLEGWHDLHRLSSSLLTLDIVLCLQMYMRLGHGRCWKRHAMRNIIGKCSR